jgi:YjbE family integral membrane protein
VEYHVDFFSLSFLSALAAIVVIDLVLAGDNAIVIAMAARRLPLLLRKKAIIWGTVGAVVVRSLMTLVVVWLLKIPGLLLIGGLLLLWIAVNLLSDEGGEGEAHTGSIGFWAAMKTIVIADAIMGLDNVLAVAGAAHGNYVLVVLGLVISVPVVVWGSGLVLRLIERFPVVIYFGAAVPRLDELIDPIEHWSWVAYVALVGAVLATGRAMQQMHARKA